jgi:ribosome-binding protein aMBF1 (putative translation factor)
MPSLQRYRKYTEAEKAAYVKREQEKYPKFKPTEKPKSKICLDVGLKIGNLRRGANLTQARLGELSGTTQSVIARVEGGRHNLTIKKLETIAKMLGRSLKIIID